MKRVLPLGSSKKVPNEALFRYFAELFKGSLV